VKVFTGAGVLLLTFWPVVTRHDTDVGTI